MANYDNRDHLSTADHCEQCLSEDASLVKEGCPPCPVCGHAATYPLGQLGNVSWSRCRACGTDFF